MSISINTRGVWKACRMTHPKELAFLIAAVTDWLTCPWPQATWGRPPKHLKAKLDSVCVMMIAINISLRDMSPYRIS